MGIAVDRRRCRRSVPAGELSQLFRLQANVMFAPDGDRGRLPLISPALQLFPSIQDLISGNVEVKQPAVQQPFNMQ